jgi:hypothetical protein
MGSDIGLGRDSNWNRGLDIMEGNLGRSLAQFGGFAVMVLASDVILRLR